ncbi:hypothetical protein [Spiroplasma endosymbiont of Aleiodes alternator]|uniref:hypothetical protein n=1 Tax=Spiroplasma endosymbiont of Aleiodes alternator TaxID=3139329 RepID=UPI003CCB19BD
MGISLYSFPHIKKYFNEKNDFDYTTLFLSMIFGSIIGLVFFNNESNKQISDKNEILLPNDIAEINNIELQNQPLTYELYPSFI